MPSEIPNMSETSRIAILVFCEKFLCLIHIFISFACQWTSQALSILYRCHIASELGQSSRNLCSSHYLHSKSYFQCSGSFVAFSPQSGVEFDVYMPFCEVCHFLVRENHRYNITHLYFTRYYSRNTCATALLQVGNDLAVPTLPIESGKVCDSRHTVISQLV